MHNSASGLTDLGRRRENNEDAFLIDAAEGLYVVADGVGGHAAGEVASHLATEGLVAALTRAQIDEPDPARALMTAICQVHNDIRTAAQSDPAKKGMASTVVAFWQHGRSGIVANVGDSRAYRLRGGALELLSLDHNLASEQRRLGATTLFPGAEHILTMVLGGETLPEPYTDVLEVEPGDRYLLCSDGLTGMVEESTIRTVVQTAASAEDGCRVLVELANRNGGRDNITVVLVFVER
jgi:protein phosphatase